jgi:hypothetical protein
MEGFRKVLFKFLELACTVRIGLEQ